MNTDIVTILGFLAVCLGTIQLVPEIFKAIKSHHLDDIAWGMLILFIIGSVAWVIYGIYVSNWPLIISDGIDLCTTTILICLKIKYTPKSKKTAYEYN